MLIWLVLSCRIYFFITDAKNYLIAYEKIKQLEPQKRKTISMQIIVLWTYFCVLFTKSENSVLSKGLIFYLILCLNQGKFWTLPLRPFQVFLSFEAGMKRKHCCFLCHTILIPSPISVKRRYKLCCSLGKIVGYNWCFPYK